MLHSVYLSLGSNIRPQENIPRALQQLSGQLSLLETSSAWHTKAIGTTGPDFVNMAVHIQTELSLYALKDDVLCKIEEGLGRVRTDNKYAPRPIDIDITLFDGEVIDSNLNHLDYLILPLSELLPDFSPTPGGITMQELATSVRTESLAVQLPHFPDFRISVS